jgi:hypothetical protein
MNWYMLTGILGQVFFFILVFITGIKLIINHRLDRTLRFIGVLFIITLFAFTILTIKIFLEEGPSAIINLGNTMFRRI